MLRLRRTDLEAIHHQARQEYPAECCGILTAPAAGRVSTVHRCRNIQDRLHAEDAVQYPRNARTAYFIDPDQLFRVVRDAEATDGLVSGFYHSHIDCDAYFSAEDRERAMAWDEPAYPDAAYLVVSVHGDGTRGAEVRGMKAFAWDAEQRDFVEVEVGIEA